MGDGATSCSVSSCPPSVATDTSIFFGVPICPSSTKNKYEEARKKRKLTFELDPSPLETSFLPLSRASSQPPIIGRTCPLAAKTTYFQLPTCRTFDWGEKGKGSKVSEERREARGFAR